MAEVKILIQGYLTSDPGSKGGTCPTISLIKDRKNNIMVDPGVLKDQKHLIKALKKEKLKIDDINYVFLTHSHFDHYKNLSLFPRAKVLEYFGVWHKDKSKKWCQGFSRDIKVVKTPGHNSNSITFFIKTGKGTIAICGDVFWKKNYPRKDPYAGNLKKLAQSRKLILSQADYIIPGHGPMFKTK